MFNSYVIDVPGLTQCYLFFLKWLGAADIMVAVAVQKLLNILCCPKIVLNCFRII